MTTFLIFFIPLLGTALGSATVFFLKEKLPQKVEKGLFGFASGVMIAASVWSLLIPALETAFMADHPWLSVLPAAIGFLAGVLFLLFMDTLLPHLHLSASSPEGVPAKFPRTVMLLLAIALHNIPEGMATGVACAGLNATDSISAASALVLSIGIAIQNLPEGAIVSMLFCTEGKSSKKAFLFGVLSGMAEPVGAVLTLLFASAFLPLMPYLLAFAAGAMIYVVVEELIPEAQSGEHSNVGTVGVALGFVLMMILDVVLG